MREYIISSQILRGGGAQVAQYTPKDLTQIDAKIINNLSMVSYLIAYHLQNDTSQEA